jgi:hypothetical protein
MSAPTFGRYAEIPVDRMTPEQRDGCRFLVEGPLGRLPGPYKVWVNNPKLMGYYTAVSLTMNFYAVPAGSPGLAR